MPQGRVAVVQSPAVPATWTFVVGHRFLAAVPAKTNCEVVERLTKRVHDVGIDVEAIVALLPMTGSAAVTSFLVVVTQEAADADGVPVSAVVRGDAVADIFSVGGSRRFSDRGIRPWLLADFRAVTGLMLGSAHAPVPAAGGLGAGQQVGPGATTGNALFWSVAHPGSVPSVADQEPDTDFDTIIRAPQRHDHDDTVLRPPGTSEARAPVNDGRERATELVVPFGFQLAPGHTFRLDQPYLVGRNPRLPRIARGDDPRLLTVPSPTSAVSSTHVEIRQEGDSIVVTDLGSTNGTVVRGPHGRPRRLRPGQSLAVTPGTVVDIGDGNIVEILQ